MTVDVSSHGREAGSIPAHWQPHPGGAWPLSACLRGIDHRHPDDLPGPADSPGGARRGDRFRPGEGFRPVTRADRPARRPSTGRWKSLDTGGRDRARRGRRRHLRPSATALRGEGGAEPRREPAQAHLRPRATTPHAGHSRSSRAATCCSDARPMSTPWFSFSPNR